MRGALPWLQELLHGGGRLRCTVLAAVIGMVVVGVVGMHQLSSGHELVTSVSAHPHFSAHPFMEVQRALPGKPLSMGKTAAGTQPHNSSGGSPGDDCPGCGDHSLPLGACLLALTLLVLAWWLAPPRVRHLPPRMLWRPATIPLGRWVPALSLAELSLLRT